MDEVIKLKAKNENEVEKMVKNTLNLKNDETFEIKEIKKPKKILFLNIEGEYEVRIVKKIDKIKKEEKKTPVVPKEKEKEKEILKKPKKEEKKEIKKTEEIKNIKPVEKKSTDSVDSIENQIRAIIKEFIVVAKLNVNIKSIQNKNGRYIIDLEGKDIRYLIGEKGTTLNSLEYLIGTIVKNAKIVIDSNGYKNKREESLRALAKKKGEKVLETGNSIKLNPMSARERKIIHEEISYMKDLETQSVGEEPKRCLVIKKKR